VSILRGAQQSREMLRNAGDHAKIIEKAEDFVSIKRSNEGGR